MATEEPLSNSIIENLEAELGYPKGSLRNKGFKPFFGKQLTDIPQEDIATVLNTLRPYLQKSMEIAQERKYRRLQQRYVSERARRTPAVPTKREVEHAMLLARRDLLSGDQSISEKTREFIEDHCPCL
ncbi:hypothetical protein K1718_27370 (plasmid) [Roseibium porphyridii]|uniref:Uncharacterized protein n=1 Tax=Roseibium porphyridii TaxID=2866279 RepID=A0ABY8FDC9_9HYPH|nr:hypothetical protein [Roseibium sp. KMA01]WFE92649.1 hypothetical protein K1718_27370 [Roseibium sp. KMA01]